LRHRQRQAPYLGVLGLVGDGGLDVEARATVLQLAARDVVRQIEAEVERAGFVRRTLQRHGDDALEVEGVALQLHRTAGHVFAEEVARRQRTFHAVAGPVVGAAGRQLHVKFGQHVVLDGDGLLGGRVAQRRRELVRPGIDLVRQLEIHRRNAEIRRGERLAEDGVAFAVGHGHVEGLPGGGAQIERAQRQRADVDHLPRLVERLVGGQQDAEVALQRDGLLQRVGTQRGLRLDDEHLVGVGVFRHGEAHIYVAGRVGRALEEHLRAPAVRRTQPHHDFGIRQRGRVAAVAHDDAQRRRATGHQPALSQHNRLVLAEVFGEIFVIECKADQPTDQDNDTQRNAYTQPGFTGHTGPPS